MSQKPVSEAQLIRDARFKRGASILQLLDMFGPVKVYHAFEINGSYTINEAIGIMRLIKSERELNPLDES